MRQALIFDRGAIGHGELWRLLTCHLLHLGPAHLWMNLAGLLVIWLLVGAAWSPRIWSLQIIVIALGTAGGLYLFSPAVGWYVGLSGLLHGMLVAGTVGQLTRRPGESAVILAVVAVKLAIEQFHGPLSGALLAGPVVVDAHLYGAITGLIIATPLLLARRRAQH